MDAASIRATFLDFFKNKAHQIVPSAPMVVKDDPTLMFTNAGMNQFKDAFLGNTKPPNVRVCDTQKCLRVSGKHNDLEEVGVDTYHHTMFEMLGNWSFGDYFKKEAIEWAWELLVDVYKIDPNRLYITIFKGDKSDGLPRDEEAANFWETLIDSSRIIECDKKDNFWEMGETGPCGPCSEIHIDIRENPENGRELVNTGHPEVIELWNLVFIEFTRLSNGNLEPLPNKHVDTGMGFERLCMVLQNKKSNYDSDVFQNLIAEIEKVSGKNHGENESIDIAQRVIADHVRAVAFAIADGQLPYREGAGYVIRRILRRAVRYGYSFLELDKPFIYSLIPALTEQLSGQYPELKLQEEIITKVIMEEEQSFLKTLARGIKKLEQVKEISGKFAFELYDTYGFPIDLTELIAEEKGITVDKTGFDKEMQVQKNRAREAAVVEFEDWTELKSGSGDEFIGYDNLNAPVNILRYRKIKQRGRGKEEYQLVFDKTPFYAESGGQVGDSGYIEINGVKTAINDTKKENNVIVHFTDQLPTDPGVQFTASVDEKRREIIANNHSATHLLHAALRTVLGDHVEQRGSLVHPDYLRFDFSHFSKVGDEELAEIEKIVNDKITENIQLEVRELPLVEAKELGAMALFGEKYGEIVRVVIFDEKYSVELCGGTHVSSTKQIATFKITNETAVAAGIRRIEAVTAKAAASKKGDQQQRVEKLIGDINKSKELISSVNDVIEAEEIKTDQLEDIICQLESVSSAIAALKLQEQLKMKKELLGGAADPVELQKLIGSFQEQSAALFKKLEKLKRKRAVGAKEDLASKIQVIDGVNCLFEKVNLDADSMKSIAFQLKKEVESLFLVLGSDLNGKALLTIVISDNLVKEKGLNASEIIREIAKEVQGGGGGQPFFATAGGKNPDGLDKALERARKFLN